MLGAGIFLLFGGQTAQAQFLAPGGLSPDFYHALLDVFSETPSFHARATIQVTNSPDKPATPIGCEIAVFGRSMRVETDSVTPGPNVPPAEAARLQTMHTISILRPDRNRIYLVFPSFRAYVEVAYAGPNANPALPPKIDKSPMGPEAVGDQPCIKSHWMVSESGGPQYDTTVWLSKNWSNFPIQIKLGTPAALVVFDNLHFDAPNGGLFEPPADYTKYEGIQDIIRHDAEKGQNGTQP
jgi:hypothetical protein